MGKKLLLFRHQTLLFVETANDSKSVGSFLGIFRRFNRVFSYRGENFLGCHGRLSPKFSPTGEPAIAERSTAKLLSRGDKENYYNELPHARELSLKVARRSYEDETTFPPSGFSRDERVLLSSRKLACMVVHRIWLRLQRKIRGFLVNAALAARRR